MATSFVGAATGLEQPQVVSDSAQSYQFSVPSTWVAKQKAGADVLYEDPRQTSTNVGVTVSPVRVRTIADFGTIDFVGEKLLKVERNKDSTLDAGILRQSTRTLPRGVTLYDFEYEVNSTRGRKRIFNAVTIADSRLFILNAQHKCDKEGCSDADTSAIETLQEIAASFTVTA